MQKDQIILRVSKTTCKKLNLIAKNFAKNKKIEFKKYDKINTPLFDELSKFSNNIDFDFSTNSHKKWCRY